MKSLLTFLAGLSFASVSFGAIDLTPKLPPFLSGLFPKTVENVDLNSFLGRWYEVASTKPFFQANCACVTADYSLRDDGKVQVVNSCRQGSAEGRLTQLTGSAVPTDDPAKLQVSFFNIPQFFSNYWIIDLADDNRYAVISTALRDPVWILSRTPEIAPEDLQGIHERLEAAGFKTSRISPTIQDNCPVNPVL